MDQVSGVVVPEVEAAGSFSAQWREQMRARFGSVLGRDVELLDTPEGLRELSRRTLAQLRALYAGVWETFPDLSGDGGAAE